MPIVLIVGDGPTLERDLTLWTLYGRPATTVIAINRGAFRFAEETGCQPDLWCSFHDDILAEWARKMPGPELHSVERKGHVIPGFVRHNIKDFEGGSAVLALRIARDHLRARRIVLAGVPMTGLYRSMAEHLKSFKNVKSLSGITAMMFGEPTLEWVHEQA